MTPPDIVSGGLGGDGPVVTAGLGLTAAPDPNAMRATIAASGALHATLTAADDNALTATLAGTSTLTAALTDPNVATQGSPRRLQPQPAPIPRPIPGHLSAYLLGSSSLSADLTGIDIDAETVIMLLDLDLMLTEGVHL